MTMLKKAAIHLISVLIFISVLILIYFVFLKQNKSEKIKDKFASELFRQQIIDFGDSYEKALLHDILNVYSPDSTEINNKIIYNIEELQADKFSDMSMKSGLEYKGLDYNTIKKTLRMYIKFLIIYLVSLLLIHSFAKTFAIWKFVKVKQGSSSYFDEFISTLKEYVNKLLPISIRKRKLNAAIKVFFKGLFKTLAYFVIFSPSYVVAYSIKGSSISDSVVFFIILAVFTNGLLINYSYRFYSILNSESKKGFVKTAIVKGLNNNYKSEMFSYKNIIKFNKKFPEHVFNHIYINAVYQNILNIKELSALLITGIVIIEMALNIQGYLCYEMLQNILYKNYDVVIFIIILIFITVKTTEFFVDLKYYNMTKKYENNQ